jgi:hypothetical protein
MYGVGQVWMVGPDPKLLQAFDLWNPYFADFLADDAYGTPSALVMDY